MFDAVGKRMLRATIGYATFQSLLDTLPIATPVFAADAASKWVSFGQDHKLQTGYPLDSPDPNLLWRLLCGFCAAD